MTFLAVIAVKYLFVLYYSYISMLSDSCYKSRAGADRGRVCLIAKLKSDEKIIPEPDDS